jgi:MFS family permease
MSVFFLIWFGQLISLLGSGLTGFALGVWVYQRTGSATALTLIAFFGMLPMIIFSPLAGALVDRWDRRWALILSETGAALTPLVLILLVAMGYFAVWPIYVIVAISGCFRAFQFPAFSAATTQLVPKEQFGRASGLTQLAQGLAQLLSPVLAGVLLLGLGVGGIYLIDLITFAFSIATLLIVRIPRPEATSAGAEGRGSLWHEMTYGWRYLLARPGLLALLLFFASSNFLMAIVVVLATPLLLSFTTPIVLGTVLSVAGSGILVGSVLMSIWGGPKHRIYGVLGSILLSGVAIIVAGLAPSAVLIGAAAFFFTLGLPIIAGSSQAIWQSKVAPDVQGRVFATRGMIATVAMPLAYLVSGPLADYVFNPLLAPNGPLSGSVGRIIGVGPGRGIGLMFIVLGLLSIVSVIVGYLYPHLRLVEEELPDAIPDTPAADSGPVAQDLAAAQP